MEKLISIIVPVYNVERYLPKCLDSIIGQTYKNLEILLVDDGSTDCSGAVCDAYALKDRRITVIHQENEGVSAARNAALKIFTGDYVGFVDSDDLADRDMFGQLYGRIEETGADIAVCGYRYIDESDQPLRGYIEPCRKSELIDRETALRYFFTTRQIEGFTWNKLYRRKFFAEHGIRYPESVQYEDIPTTARLLGEASGLCFTGRALYSYRLRRGSITGTATAQNRVALLKALQAVEPLARTVGLDDAYRYYLGTRLIPELFRLLRYVSVGEAGELVELFYNNNFDMAGLRFWRDCIVRLRYWRPGIRYIKIIVMYILLKRIVRRTESRNG